MEPIEPYVRVEELPAPSVLVVRGGPITAEKLLEAAEGNRPSTPARRSPGVRVGRGGDGRVDVGTGTGRTSGDEDPYATTTVGQVVNAQLVLLPTFAAPHYDVVLEDATVDEVARLMSLLSDPIRNPYRRKGR